MDAWEATKVVFDRVRALDPENASKIMGLLLIQDNSVKDLIRLAFGPEHLLLAVVARARADLAAKPASPPSPPGLGPPWGLPSPGGGGDHLSPFAADNAAFDGGADAFYPEEYECWSPAGAGHRRSFSLSDDEVAAAAAWRPCMYFARGFCKNGSSCRFLHGLPDDDAEATEREMVVMRAKALAASAAARPQQLMASAFPFSPSPPKGGFGLNSLLQQQNEPQRCHFVLPNVAFLCPFRALLISIVASGRRRRAPCFLAVARTCTGSRCARLGWTAATSSPAPPRGRSTSPSRPTPPSARRTSPTTSGTRHAAIIGVCSLLCLDGID